MYRCDGYLNVRSSMTSHEQLASAVCICDMLYFISSDTVHPLNFDWTRGEVEPLWLYEHVQAAKWNVHEVAAFVK